MELKPIRLLPTFVHRTYRGGKKLRAFLGLPDCVDSDQPEDWISSFTEAKNKEYIKNEGISRAEGDRLLAEVVGQDVFGEGRTDSGVLIKLLDAGERLGIQVHPTKAYAKRMFGSDYGKTECWYVLSADKDACVYLGFQPWVTKELWRELFEKQDIAGMLNALHRFAVHPGDVILVTGGTPHAIGKGCFLVEIQEPSDYTMRAEKTTASGEPLTPQQVHYGVGEQAMLDCFCYAGADEAQIRQQFFLNPHTGEQGEIRLVTYADTPCFALSRVDRTDYHAKVDHCVTAVVLEDGGHLISGESIWDLRRGDRFFIPAGSEWTLQSAKVLLCYPPQKA